MVKRLFLLNLLTFLSGCYYLQRPIAPIEQAHYPAEAGYVYQPSAPATRAPDLLIMLPGMGDGIDRFAREGLIEQVKQAQLPLDVVVVNAHFNYYRSRSLLTRLQADVIAPAQNAAYRHIHLAGVSLGGFGTLLYWRDKAPLDSALLLTPYLGEPEYYQHRLEPSARPQALDEEKNLWPWLEQQTPRTREHWYLGMAREDEFYTANALLADMLAPEHAVQVEGGHNWNSWRELWPQMLSQFKRDFYSQGNHL